MTMSYRIPHSAFRMSLIVAIASAARAVHADDTVVGSPHDLSALSPNRVRSLTEDQVCVFCHLPHSPSPQSPAWRRAEPRLHYRVYRSSTTDARIDQPSGVSKMCLSCHDGLMALGMSGDLPTQCGTGVSPVSEKLSPSGGQDRRDAGPTNAVMTRRYLPPGKTNLTDDLRDDHPIGFRFDRALARRDRQLRSPDLISRTIPLGKHNEVHCTACHDPHNNRLGEFLRITDRRGSLCITCHDLRGWRGSTHANSPIATPGRRVDPTERLKYSTLADNACAGCHKVHTAPHAERLLRNERDEDNCLNCHDGSVATTDILSQIRRASGHRGDRRTGIHDPAERTQTMRPHVTCTDCHNPHSVEPTQRVLIRTIAPVPAAGAIKNAPGVDAHGRPVKFANYAYEICLRCHADNPIRVGSRLTRQVNEGNTRNEFQPTNASYHPVFAARRNPDVVSLISPYRVGVTVTCTDCHSSDDSPIGGGFGPQGPHGSRFAPLLANQYETRDMTVESAQSYALCYRCHDRNSILSDTSFPLHRLHVVVARTPCSACHDPHGVRAVGGLDGSHTNLINFDTRIVRPVRTGFGLEPTRFDDTGRYSGSCTLACHGVDHIRLQYGTGAAPKPILGSVRR